MSLVYSTNFVLLLIIYTLSKEEMKKKNYNKLKNIVKNKIFDLILDAHGSIRSNYILKTIKLNSTVYTINKRSLSRYFLTWFKINLASKSCSRIQDYLNLLRNLTKRQLTTDTELFIKESEIEEIKTLIQSVLIKDNFIIAIAPGARYKEKIWLSEYWLELIHKIKKQNFSVVLIGTKADEQKNLWIRQIEQKTCNLMGKLNLRQTMSVLSIIDTAVTNDSAMLHLTEAAKKPAIAIFGPTVKEYGFAPALNKSYLLETKLYCRPCNVHGKACCTKPDL